MRRFVRIAAALFGVAMPYLLFALAQTSRLHDAVHSNDMEGIRNALKPWKFIDGRDSRGYTPLRIAINNKNLAATEFLLDNGASLWPRQIANIRTDYLDMAVKLGHIDTVKLLLDRGAPINESRAICSAVHSVDVDMVDLLLKQGANPNTLKQHQKVPALFCLPYSRDRDSQTFDILEALIEHGADIGHYLPSGHSLLSNAMYKRPADIEMMRFLISKGFPLTPGPQGGTPLRYAARAKRVDAVRVLLEGGANANDFGIECRVECRGRTTALHEAVYLQSHQYPDRKPQSAEITTMLLKHGAKPNVFNGLGKTPLFLATYSNNKEAADLLLDAGANPEFDAPPEKRRAQRSAATPKFSDR